MNRQRGRAASGASTAARRWWPLAVEVALRAFNVPLFPGFAPLAVEETWSARLGYAAILAGVEMRFLGLAAWEFVAAALAGLAIARRARLGLAAAAAVSALLWTLLGLATHHFPIGALGFETLLTAVLVRPIGSEALSGFVSRLGIMFLVGASIALVSAARRVVPRVWPAVLAAALFASAGHRMEGPQPETPGASDATLWFDFAEADPRALDHPVLAEATRTNEVCLACHRAMIGPTDRPPAQKGMHEIHYGPARFDRPCVFCHQTAGEPGFPGPHPRQNARNEYNQRCIECHTRDGAPAWEGSVR